MNHCYVEFKITSTEQFSRLQQIVEALRKAKEEDQFPDDEQWKQFFSDEEISTFWGKKNIKKSAMFAEKV